MDNAETALPYPCVEYGNYHLTKGPYNTPVAPTGTCPDCGAVDKFDPAFITIQANKIRVHSLCKKCGHGITVAEAQLTLMTCEPCLQNPATS